MHKRYNAKQTLDYANKTNENGFEENKKMSFLG